MKRLALAFLASAISAGVSACVIAEDVETSQNHSEGTTRQGLTQSAASASETKFWCHNDWDCASDETCQDGTCQRISSPPRPTTPSSPSSGYCQTDGDCGYGSYCYGGTCYSSGSHSDPGSGGGDFPIYGG